MRQEIKEGLNFVIKHPQIEPVISCGVVYVLFLSIVEAVLVLYCHQVLGMSPITIGFVIGSAAAGYPLGNIISTHLINRIGVERTLIVGAAFASTGLALTPVMASYHLVYGLIIAGIIHGIGTGAFGPTFLTLRHVQTPENMLGRVNSVQRFFIWGAIPVGSLISSLLISIWGLGFALWVGGLGSLLFLVPLLRRDILLKSLEPRKSTSV